MVISRIGGVQVSTGGKECVVGEGHPLVLSDTKNSLKCEKASLQPWSRSGLKVIKGIYKEWDRNFTRIST
jgi:hypothetical protein